MTKDHSASAESHLAHHFDGPAQQFSAGALGMWLFLGTELLMFGGLFCVYAALRSNHPEIFQFGAHHLDRTFGVLNTTVLIFSSLTMALAVRAAQTNQKRQLVLFLSLTLICGVDFLAVKYIEYSKKFEEGLLWGRGFYQGEHALGGEAAAVAVGPGNVDKGRQQFESTCAACHGRQAEGMKNLGPALRENAFIQSLDDPHLLAFVKTGREADDPLNKTGIVMPAKGGNPLLGDQDLMDIVAHLRTLQSTTPGAGEPAKQAAPAMVATQDVGDEIFRSVIPLAAAGPVGLSRSSSRTVSAAPVNERPPANAHLFYAIYFCMTGLHGVHVLVGIFLIAWLRGRALKGDFGSQYFTPVELIGLYWHVVDVIWIFLFPLFYLI